LVDEDLEEELLELEDAPAFNEACGVVLGRGGIYSLSLHLAKSAL
jgi:hypothetical protein